MVLRRDRPAPSAATSSRLVKAGVVAADLLVVSLAALVMFQTLEGHRSAARANAENLARFLAGGLDASAPSGGAPAASAARRAP